MGEVAGKPETCDGADNDCDGDVDEGLTPKSVSELRPCYDGPDGTALIGICRPGFLVCEHGREVCKGQQLPLAAECNVAGDDRDCDGRADEPADPTRAVDVVALLDPSGSMGEYDDALAYALEAFATAHAASARVRMALVLVPGATEGECELAVDLDAPGELARVFRSYASTWAAFEPSIDCAADLASGALRVSWTPGSRRIAVFAGDEEAQTGRARVAWTWNDEARTAAAAAGKALAGADVTLHVFTKREVQHTYETLVDPTGGAIHRLDAPTLEADLRALLYDAVCE